MVIGGVFIHIPDELAGSVSLCHGIMIDGGEKGFRQGNGENVRHDGTGGCGKVQTIQLVPQKFKALQIQQIRFVGVLAFGAEGGGTHFRVAVFVQTADAACEDDALTHRGGSFCTVSAVCASDGKAVFIQGDNVGIEGGIFRKIRELPGVQPCADKGREQIRLCRFRIPGGSFCGVGRGGGGHIRVCGRRNIAGHSITCGQSGSAQQEYRQQ